MLSRAESSETVENSEDKARTTLSRGQSPRQLARRSVPTWRAAGAPGSGRSSGCRASTSSQSTSPAGSSTSHLAATAQQAIYVDDHDRTRFLSSSRSRRSPSLVALLAYCLMTNHFHLVLDDADEPTLSAGMHWLNGCYAQWFNRRHGSKGHLFEDRFHCEPIETESHFLEITRYLPLNPVRARICHHPGEWPWSSYRALTGRAVRESRLGRRGARAVRTERRLGPNRLQSLRR